MITGNLMGNNIPILMFKNGEVLNVDYVEGDLVAGEYNEKEELVPFHSIEYNFDRNLMENVKTLYRDIIRKYPEYDVEEIEENE